MTIRSRVVRHGAARSRALVFVDDVVVDSRTQTIALTGGERREGRIATQIIVKGVGPTRYANNRFSRRASGSLTLLQAERDWVHSEALARGGVPVYRPLELALLPSLQSGTPRWAGARS